MRPGSIRPGDSAGGPSQTTALIALAVEQHYGFWETQGQILQGWAQAAQQPAAGLTQMLQGLQAYRPRSQNRPGHFCCCWPRWQGKPGSPQRDKPGWAKRRP